MKKKLLPLLIILFLTGCSKIDNDTKEYSKIINDILVTNNHNVNTASVGYKYYLPIGVDLAYDSDFNKEFKVKDNKIVLYVDIVSYFYKNNLNYKEENTSNYYFSKFSNGYISIDENEENYYLKIIYNYAKIESYVKKGDLVDVIAYSTIILNSINYNDNLISNFIEEGISFGGEINYEIDKPGDSESKFSQYLQEYVQDSNEEQKKEELPLEQD